MVARNRIRCQVVAVPADDSSTSPHRVVRQRMIRPSDMVPWADPYISALIKKLQAEVRSERGGAVRTDRMASPVAARAQTHKLCCEAEVPWNEDEFEYDPLEERCLPNFEDREE